MFIAARIANFDYISSLKKTGLLTQIGRGNVYRQNIWHFKRINQYSSTQDSNLASALFISLFFGS
jgi:hypothetical protein